MTSANPFRKLIEVAISKGISEQELADLFAVSPGTIQRYKEGTVRPERSLQLAMATLIMRRLDEKKRQIDWSPHDEERVVDSQYGTPTFKDKK